MAGGQQSLLNDEEIPVDLVGNDIDDKDDKEDESETAEDNKKTPLLAATRTGVIELVKELDTQDASSSS
ncbi:hypothetical protein QYF36_004685 [Acer negundo]|nr:hypothetical protein QYF36_004685 [Acer negundo]